MFKVGDIVEITEEADADGMLDFIKGKGYPVMEWSRDVCSGGYATIYIDQIKLKDESGRVNWYGSGFFKLKEKEDVMDNVTEKKECLFKKGQVVWDIIYGKGVVKSYDTLNRPYPVAVVFEDGGYEYYTEDGKLELGDKSRRLFFSEPKIEAATEPVFQPVLKEGQPVILTRLGVEVQMVAGWVHEERMNEIEVMTEHEPYATYSKGEWAVHCVGEKIVFN